MVYWDWQRKWWRKEIYSSILNIASVHLSLNLNHVSLPLFKKPRHMYFLVTVKTKINDYYSTAILRWLLPVKKHAINWIWKQSWNKTFQWNVSETMKKWKKKKLDRVQFTWKELMEKICMLVRTCLNSEKIEVAKVWQF